MSDGDPDLMDFAMILLMGVFFLAGLLLGIAIGTPEPPPDPCILGDGIVPCLPPPCVTEPCVPPPLPPPPPIEPPEEPPIDPPEEEPCLKPRDPPCHGHDD